jgi:hypothetical protein
MTKKQSDESSKEIVKSNEVTKLLLDIPPDSIILNECSRTLMVSFLLEKQKNLFVADRIASKIQGVEPKFKAPQHLDNLVKALTAFHNAQYNLIYECWEDLKKAAIKEHLIPDNAQPKDFCKLMLETYYINV